MNPGYIALAAVLALAVGIAVWFPLWQRRTINTVRYVIINESTHQACFGGKRFRSRWKAVKYTQARIPINFQTLFRYSTRAVIKRNGKWQAFGDHPVAIRPAHVQRNPFLRGFGR